jgi:hypothetical protein
LLYWYFFRNKWIPLLTKNISKFKQKKSTKPLIQYQ